jgi:hypothetical protein
MSQINVIPSQKINDAAGGNEALREILLAMANTNNLQTDATNTASGKNVPQQAKATVSYLQGSYVVQIENPGAVAPTSALQAAQAKAGATVSSTIAPVTAIYHQIRAATSPRFSISDSVQVFGSDTGSTQTYWTISNLGSGRFYFQIRSSYDGKNWNLWRNANGGQTITTQPDGVTVEATNNAVFGVFELPGKQLVSFGSGLVSNGNSFGVPEQLYTSAMKAIAGPNGFQAQSSNLAHGIVAENVSLQVPNPQPPTTGPTDYPTVVQMLYQDGLGHQWPGTCNIFAFMYDPLGTNIREETTGDGSWVDITLSGGAHLSIGSGVTNDGAAIGLPSTMPWVSPSTMLSIVSPNVGFSASRQARGITVANIDSGGVLHCQFQDTTDHAWSSTGNWVAIAWTPGLPVETVTGGKWLVLTLPTGSKIAIGGGSGGNGSAFAMPSGFSSLNMLAIATPASADETSHPMAGVYECGILGTTLQLSYNDTEGNFWNGNVNWMAFAWQ